MRKTTLTLFFSFALTFFTFSSCEDDDKKDNNPIIDIPDNPTTSSDKILGGDISMLPQYQDFGTIYKDFSGKTISLLPYLKDNGMNCMRVRLFVDPTKEKEVVQDINYVLSLAKQIKAHGFRFMLDFHYSDSWADPAQQTIPAAWKSLDADGLVDILYKYTKETLSEFVSQGLSPDYIQIGNEISYGMLWKYGRVNYQSSDNWDTLARMLNSAGKACREITPDAKIIIHIERSVNAANCIYFLGTMKKLNVDFDIFGLSYYPVWHGPVNELDKTITSIENTTDKDIMFVEFAYNYKWYPQDAKFTETQIGYSATADGQKKITADLISVLNKHKKVTGLLWWFPEENECPFTNLLTSWKNRGLFDNETGNALPALYELKNFIDKE